MILEPYDIKIIDLEKDDCSYFNDIVRVGKNDYYQFTSKSYKLDKGYFVRCTGAPIQTTSILGELYSLENVMSYGTFVRARDTLFLEEELANYYA